MCCLVYVSESNVNRERLPHSLALPSPGLRRATAQPSPAPWRQGLHAQYSSGAAASLGGGGEQPCICAALNGGAPGGRGRANACAPSCLRSSLRSAEADGGQIKGCAECSDKCVLTEDSNGRLDINSSVLSFFWFKVEADVEVDESCARILPFRSLCLKLSA